MTTPIVRGDSEEKRWGDREEARVRSIVGVTTIISILAVIVNAKDGLRRTGILSGTHWDGYRCQHAVTR